MVAALAVALLLVPVVLAVAAPALAAVPVVTAPPAPRYPLPAPASGVPAHLDGLFDSFPLVATDLPDDQSRQAVADFQQARIDQPEIMVRMYVDAWKGISDTIGQSDVNDKIVPLVEQLNQGADFGGPGSDSAKKLATLWTPSLPALTADPRNADRLNNVAVGLIGLSVALGEGAQNSSVNVNSYHSTEPGYDSWQFGYGPGLGAAGLWLLQAVAQAFPANRAVLLNLAYFTSVAPPAPGTVPVQAAIPFAQRWLSASPDDATARLLLGSLQSRQTDTPVALDQATATLAPLAQSPVTQSLGHAALGDAALAQATLHQADAPYLAQDDARRALTEYDQALGGTTDPGVYAGRAAALDLLGDEADALQALATAAKLEPSSAELQLRLAELQEKRGDFEAMRQSARAALMAGTLPGGFAPAYSDVRFVLLQSAMLPGDRGFLGYSVGSDRTHDPFLAYVEQGAAFLVVLDAVPQTDLGETDTEAAWNDEWRLSAGTPSVARALAISASILLGDAGGARSDGATAAQALAATLVANGSLPAGGTDPDTLNAALHQAQNILRHAGRFADAAALCGRAAAAPSSAGFDQIAALRCQGEADYLGQRYADAASVLQHTYQAALAAGPSDLTGTLQLEAAGAAEAADQTEQARTGFIATTAAAFADDTAAGRAVVALSKLGELDLSAGDPASAIAHYDLMLASLAPTGPLLAPGGAPAALEARPVAARAYLNRGLARLWLLEPSPETAPSCAGDHRATCLAARQDFAAALAIDPRDPVFLLDAAWADRLLGEDQAARAELAQSVAVNPSSYPAQNDLGVLAARAGDPRTAQHAFEAALSADPGYDLAAWNLGVLELQRGIRGIPRGEALLARAIAEHPALRDHPVDYLTDERVYRVTLTGDQPPSIAGAAGGSYTLATLALGSLIVVAAGAQAFGLEFNRKVLSTLADQARDKLPERGEALRARLSRFAGVTTRLAVPSPVIPWLVTLPALGVVTVVSVLQAKPDATIAVALVALFAALLAVVAHEAGHRLMRWRLGGQVAPAAWGSGIVLSLLLLPVEISAGPFVGHRVTHDSAKRAWWIAVGGPAANLVVALVATGLFMLHPLPLLRLVAQVQLAAIGFALLPVEPLDGPILKQHKTFFLLAGLLLTAVGFIVAQGRF